MDVQDQKYYDLSVRLEDAWKGILRITNARHRLDLRKLHLVAESALRLANQAQTPAIVKPVPSIKYAERLAAADHAIKQVEQYLMLARLQEPFDKKSKW